MAAEKKESLLDKMSKLFGPGIEDSNRSMHQGITTSNDAWEAAEQIAERQKAFRVRKGIFWNGSKQ